MATKKAFAAAVSFNDTRKKKRDRRWREQKGHTGREQGAPSETKKRYLQKGVTSRGRRNTETANAELAPGKIEHGS